VTQSLKTCWKPGLVAAACAALAACAPMPKLGAPAAELDAARSGLLTESPSADSRLSSAAWWQAWQSPELDQLVQRALAESPNLASAQARVARASAAAQAAGAAEGPALGAGVELTRQRFTEHGLYPPPLAGSVRNVGTLQLGFSYEFDFFGRHSAALAAAVGRQRAAQADAEAARLALSSRVARAYVELARSLAQARLIDEQLQQREQLLALVRQRAEAGLDTALDQRQNELPLHELKRQRLQLDEQAQGLRLQLAALTVQGPGALKDLAPQLPQPLALDAAQAPGIDLLGRRPDIVAARWMAEASRAQVKQARAQFYPNVSLSAFAGFNAIGLDRVLEIGSRQAGVTPALHLPLFDSGRLSAQLKGAAADADGAVATYNATLLDAVRDVNEQLLGLRSLQAQQREQQAQLAKTRELQGLAEQRAAAGLSGRVAVLAAQLQTLAQQRQQLDLQAQTVLAEVGVLRSLGGGWSEVNARP
jgi:NodT family efflux transporter outer membrane factor (OMF) lipoprotein